MIIERFNKIKSNINKLKPSKQVNIIAVSKTFSLDYIKPLIDEGHVHFGENKVQEAITKWKDIKTLNQNLKFVIISKFTSISQVRFFFEACDLFSTRILIADIFFTLKRRNFCIFFWKCRAEISTIQKCKNDARQKGRLVESPKKPRSCRVVVYHEFELPFHFR